MAVVSPGEPAPHRIGSGPLDIATSPDGATVWVANGASATVSILDAATGAVRHTISLQRGYNLTTSIVFSPDGSRAYVGDISAMVVHVIDTATRTEVATLRGIHEAQDLAVSPDGRLLYAALWWGGVEVRDAVTGQRLGLIPVGGGVAQLELSPDGRWLFATNLGRGVPEPLFVAVADTTTRAEVARIEPPGETLQAAMTLSPDGRTLYIGCADGTIQVVDTATNTVRSTFSGVVSPRGLLVVGDHLYVTSYATDSVGVFDLSSQSLRWSVPVGDTPVALAANATGTSLFVTNLVPGTVTVVRIG